MNTLSDQHLVDHPGPSRSQLELARNRRRRAVRRRRAQIAFLLGTLGMTLSTCYIANHYRVVYDRTHGRLMVLTIAQADRLFKSGSLHPGAAIPG